MRGEVELRDPIYKTRLTICKISGRGCPSPIALRSGPANGRPGVTGPRWGQDGTKGGEAQGDRVKKPHLVTVRRTDRSS